jgi:hypothetical protein
MNKIRLFYAVFSFWPFKDLHFHTRAYLRKNSLEILFTRCRLYYGSNEICCIFQICCILSLLFDAKYLFLFIILIFPFQIFRFCKPYT